MWLLRKILFPVSIAYMLVVYLRNYLYDIAIFKSKSYKTKVICVGNLSTGGTGKTPMIEYLISFLQANTKVAVLSRGYRRKSKGFILADTSKNVEDLGDEPFQIFSKFPEVVLAVDANRQNGIAELEKHKPDVILLDDGYQHRKVKPGFSILLTAYNQLYTKDWYLPTGNLRDSKKEAKRANIIVVTKCPENLEKETQAAILKGLKPKLNQQVIFSFLSYGKEFVGVNNTISQSFLKDREVTLVTGIANPKPLVTYLKTIGIVFKHLEFKDHHFFTEKQLQLLNSKECVLTTEKDFVRLKEEVKEVYYVSVKHEFMGEGSNQLTESLTKFMKQNP